MKNLQRAALRAAGATLVASTPRAVHAAPRAEPTDALTQIAAINAAVTAMREKHEEALAGRLTLAFRFTAPLLVRATGRSNSVVNMTGAGERGETRNILGCGIQNFKTLWRWNTVSVDDQGKYLHNRYSRFPPAVSGSRSSCQLRK